MFSLTQQTTTTVVETHTTGQPAAVVAHDPGAADHAAPSHGDAVTVQPDGHAPEAAVGMPQLDTTHFGNQIFWLFVTLGLIYWILSRFALPRISAVLADRQGAITSDLMAAEEFKSRARDAEAAYDKALADARSEAQKIVAANLADIQAELDRAIAHADAEISARTAQSEQRIGEIRATSLDDARSVARSVAGDIVAAMGGQIDAAALEAAVDQRINQEVRA